ncbi:MAG TPA: lysylphosphatidylglycerol synthase domain-containing protein, partial [Pseudomonadales bacterium]|nr:lysylphosphatidylglycerol synthase domain-containing protein [Pseudomonadales bacterium]
MKILFRVVSGFLLVAVLAYFVLYTIRTLKTQDFSALFSATSLSAIFFAACLYALIIPFSAWAWHILLEKRDERWSVKLLASIMGTTQLAKYIPGNIAQHLGRAALSMRYGMTMKTYMVTVVQETLLAVGASLLIGMCFLQMSPLVYDRLPERYQMLLLISSLIFVLLILVLFMGYVKAPAWLTRNTAGTRLNEL